jgi:hypothetical protein
MLKGLASRFLQKASSRVVSELQMGTLGSTSAVGQKTLAALYQQNHHLGVPAPGFRDVGFRVHSQNEEDGILHFIFSIIGTTNKRCVEVCAGNGIENNTANLVLNHRWIGLMFDGSQPNIDAARDFFAQHPDSAIAPPTIVKAWITRENINSLIEDNGFKGSIDLFSLDIDGVDYWVWESLTCIDPRVVVLECNHLWGPGPCVTVPYSESFVCEYTQHGSDYAGASLGAFVKLGRKKGYRFVGTNATATNAFFVKQDIVSSWLPEAEMATCFDHPRAQFGIKVRLPKVKDKKWVEV